jgi:polar amino acid transport system substrate-binding protein
MHKLLLTAAATAVAVALAAAPAAAQTLEKIKQRGVIVVGSKADYKPFGFRDPSGAIVGFEPDIAKLVAEKLGVKLEIEPVVSSNRMQFLQQGKIDLMIATMNDKPDRRKVVYIVEPSYYASSVNVLAPKSAKLKDWTDLKGKKVCMIQGAWYNKQLQQDYGMEDVAFKGTAEVFTALKGNNCVAFAYDDTLILATLLEPEWKDYEMPLKSILEDPWGLAVKLGEEKFYKFMSDMVTDWHRTGRIVELEKKYGMGNTSFAVKMYDKHKK